MARAATTNSRFGISWVVLAWLVIGVVVAINQDYGHNLDTASQIATFIFGVILWPVLITGGDVGVTF